MNGNPPDRSGKGYERSDARPAPILLFGAVLALGIAASLLASAWIAGAFAGRSTAARTPSHPMAEARARGGGPTLQANPAAELLEHRRREAELLETYGWVDPQAGIVRIPIDRAIELVAERGLPARPALRDGDGGDR